MGIALHKRKSSGSTLMTEGTIWKHILLFSIPLILGNMLQQLYNPWIPSSLEIHSEVKRWRPLVPVLL